MGGLPPVSDDEWQRVQKALDDNAGNISRAAKALGIPRQTLQSRLKNHDAPDGYKVRGTSTLYGPDGDVRLTWVKTREDVERQEQILRETVAAFVAEIKPVNRRASPKIKNSDLCVAYCIGDAHIGLYAWGAETGADFDLSIATKDLISAADRLDRKS